MATNRETAEAIFASYVGLRKTTDIVFLSYGALAEMIGRKGQGRLLAAPLDLVREICRAQELPDIATVIVSKESLLDGTLMPAPNAVEKYNGWVGLRKEQAKVLAFDFQPALGRDLRRP